MQFGPQQSESQNREPADEWYAAYVKHHHEKKAAGLLDGKGMEVFLPTQKTVRKWKDRRKTLVVPLFPGYLFVRCNLEKKIAIVNTPGVFFLVESNGRPCPIPTNEIETLRRVVECGTPAHSHAFISAGDRVRICSGPLAGVSGLLTRFKNQYRIVLAVELLRKAVSIEVEIDNVEPVRDASALTGPGKTLVTSA